MKIIKSILIVLMVVGINFTAHAEDEEPDTPPIDPGTAPINDYLPIAFVAAAGLGYVLLRKKTIKL